MRIRLKRAATIGRYTIDATNVVDVPPENESYALWLVETGGAELTTDAITGQSVPKAPVTDDTPQPFRRGPGRPRKNP